MSVGIREAYELRKRNGGTATTFVWCGIATGVDNVNHLTEVSFIRGEGRGEGGGEIWQCKISGLSGWYNMPVNNTAFLGRGEMAM